MCEEIARAIEYREFGLYAEAASVLRHWINITPSDPIGYALLAQIFLFDQQGGLAWASLNRALAIDSALPIVQRNCARLLLREQKNGEALLAAQAAYQGDERDIENMIVFAACLGANGKNERAFLLVEQALQERPGYAEAFHCRALLRLNINDRAGSLADAERSLSIKPHLTQLWGLVASLCLQLKNLPGAIKALEKALSSEPNDVKYIANLGECKHQLGTLLEAERWLQRALGIRPKAAALRFRLADVLEEQNRDDEALAVLMGAQQNCPKDVAALQALANYHSKRKQWLEAEHWVRSVLKHKPEEVKALCQLAAVLHEQDRDNEVFAMLQEALQYQPGDPTTLLAMVEHHIKHKRWHEAYRWVRRALVLQPNWGHIYQFQGAVLQRLEKPEEAKAAYRRALTVSPSFTQAIINLSLLYISQGRSRNALETLKRSSTQCETSVEKSIFVNCVERLGGSLDDAWVATMLIRAITEPWTRPGDLATVCTNMVKRAPTMKLLLARASDAWPIRMAASDFLGSASLMEISKNHLLLALLCSTRICDIQMERFLTLLRFAMLDAAACATVETSEKVDHLLVICSALSHQCFINDYVFHHTEEEIEKAEQLRSLLNTHIDFGMPIPALWVLIIAAYFPLSSLPGASKLSNRQWPDAVSSVLEQQVREPLLELALRSTIPRLTSITDVTSILVQRQYEEFPYPRWIKSAPAGDKKSIGEYLRSTLPLASVADHSVASDMSILIAGCGTGQHSIQTAQTFRCSSILAVDLSGRSLAYAKRKTQELGMTIIEYAQADLLELGQLNRRFDLIESVGVLHHLADPWAGWRVLSSKLHPCGYMRIGLYSKAARRNISKAKAVAAEFGFGDSAGDIRNFRQKLIDLNLNGDYLHTLRFSDFYSISTCRDLLFHTQEHQTSFTEISDFLKTTDLRFLGLETDASTLDRYKRRFPNDPSAADLWQWQIFENEHPEVFAGMYLFWVQSTVVQ